MIQTLYKTGGGSIAFAKSISPYHPTQADMRRTSSQTINFLHVRGTFPSCVCRLFIEMDFLGPKLGDVLLGVFRFLLPEQGSFLVCGLLDHLLFVAVYKVFYDRPIPGLTRYQTIKFWTSSN